MHSDTDAARPVALVMEYDQWERARAMHVLSAEGYQVHGASNGASGLRLAEQNLFDLILLDLHLPEVHGCQVLQQLKSTRSTRNVPVILIGAPSREDGLLAEGFLRRPLEDSRVAEEVGRVMMRNAAPHDVANLPGAGGLTALPLPGRGRSRPLVIVASSDMHVVDQLASQVRGKGWIACTTTSPAGCLRVATAIAPDLVLLDTTVPRRIDALLRAHPISASAAIVRISAAALGEGVLAPTPTPRAVRPASWLERLNGVFRPLSIKPRHTR